MWFRNHYRKGIIFSVPNETHNMMELLRKKATGLLPGASDLVVVLDSRVLFVEVKDDKGRQSKAQLRFQNDAESLNHHYFLVRSLKDFKKIPYICDY